MKKFLVLAAVVCVFSASVVGCNSASSPIVMKATPK